VKMLVAVIGILSAYTLIYMGMSHYWTGDGSPFAGYSGS
jgi:hypothetical protein